MAQTQAALAGANRRWPSDYGRTQERAIGRAESSSDREYGDKVPSLSECRGAKLSKGWTKLRRQNFAEEDEKSRLELLGELRSETGWIGRTKLTFLESRTLLD